MSEAEAANPNSTPPARTAVAGHVDFSAQLDSFQGPLDLLLYLIRENEVEITDIPISRILEQYLRFLDQAVQWDLQLAGEFLVMAATLMEIKSRELLPVQDRPGEDEEIIEDPRSELVRQLLEYRRLKDQARGLEELQNTWERCRPRGLFGDVPEAPETASAEADRARASDALVDVDLYALFAAYERILRAVLAQAPRSIVADKETLEQKIARIEAALLARPCAHFLELVADPSSRPDVAATFVALLELVRRRAVRLIQQRDYGAFSVKVQTAEEVAAQTHAEAETAEAAAAAAINAKAEQDALLAAQAQAAGVPLPFLLKKRAPPRPHFKGIVRPEDLEELDAEEAEIARRIDAILAAADAISERFEQSQRPPQPPPPADGVPQASQPADGSAPTAASSSGPPEASPASPPAPAASAPGQTTPPPAPPSQPADAADTPKSDQQP